MSDERTLWSRVWAPFDRFIDQMIFEAEPSRPVRGERVAAASVQPDPSFEMQPDKPIEKSEDDRFGRRSFAARAASVLARRADPSSIIVGIFGPWGDGKTSTLMMMREALRKDPRIIIIDYNPWFFEGSTETLTRSFFNTLATSLEKSPIFSRENIGGLLERYAEALPKVGKPLANFGKRIATEQLSAARDRIRDVLKRHGKRVVIFVDDIDRLDRREIQTLFKLVRLSGDFDYTSYVLAFDDKMVAEALSESYGGSAAAGSRFLEKIIQVPLHLPAANPLTLRDLAFSSCDRVLQENQIELSRDQASELGSAFAMGFGPVLRTPRQVKVFDNAITFAVPILKGEVNVVDQILIEGVRVFYPRLYELMRDNSEVFLSGTGGHRNDERKAEKDALVDVALTAAGVRSQEHRSVRNMLVEKLFPRFAETHYGGDWELGWATEKRVCSSAYFPRYFSYGIPEKDVPDAAIDRLVLEASVGDASDIAEAVVGFLSAGNAPILITKLRQREETLPDEAIDGLISVLVLLLNEMEDDSPAFGRSRYDDASLLFSKLLTRVTSARRAGLLNVVLTGLNDASFAFQILRWMRKDTTEGQARGILEAKAHSKAVDVVVDRWLEKFAKDVATGLPERGAGMFLGYANEYASPAVRRKLDARLAEFVRSDTQGSITLLRAITPVATNLSTGRSKHADLRIDTYERIAKMVDTSEMLASLSSLYGEKLDVSDYPSSFDDEDDEATVNLRLAQQFLFVHRMAEDKAREAASNGSDEGR